MYHIIADGEYWKDGEGVFAWPLAMAHSIADGLRAWGFSVRFERYEEAE